MQLYFGVRELRSRSAVVSLGGVEAASIQWSHSGECFVPWMAQGTTQALRCYKLLYIV